MGTEFSGREGDIFVRRVSLELYPRPRGFYLEELEILDPNLHSLLLPINEADLTW